MPQRELMLIETAARLTVIDLCQGWWGLRQRVAIAKAYKTFADNIAELRKELPDDPRNP